MPLLKKRLRAPDCSYEIGLDARGFLLEVAQTKRNEVRIADKNNGSSALVVQSTGLKVDHHVFCTFVIHFQHWPKQGSMVNNWVGPFISD